MPGENRMGAPRGAAYNVAVVGIMSAFLLMVQVALAALPNIELVSFLIVVYALYLGRNTLYAIYVFALVEGLIYGFSDWWISYLYVWTVLYFVARLCGRLKIDKALFWAVVSGIFGLCFGALCSIPYFFILGPGGGVAFFISGIPFDLLHCGGNFIVMLLLYRPVGKAFKLLEQRHIV